MSQVLAFPKDPRTLRVRHPRTGFERLPRDLSRAELFRFFTFSDADLRQIQMCRGDTNRLGFATLLGGVRLTGRFPYDLELVSQSLIAHVARQLQINAPHAISYPQRRPTRHEHITRLKDFLGLRSFIENDVPLLTAHVCEEIMTGARWHTLLGSCEWFLREQQIVLPGVKVLERLIGTARLVAEDALYQSLCARVSKAQAARILALLEPIEGQKHTPFQLLQQAGKRPSPKALERELTSLEQVRCLLPSSLDLTDLHPHLLERLAGLLSGIHTRTLKRFAQPKQLALMLCWLWRLRSRLVDTSLVIGNDLIAGVFRRARNSAEREQKRQRQQVGEVARACGEVIEILLDTAIPDDQLRKMIFKRVPPERMTRLASECAELSGPNERLLTNELRKRYGYVRQFAPKLIEAFAMRSATPDDALLKAVNYLRERNRRGEKHFDATAPLDFVPSVWKAQVCPAPGVIDRALWEMCLLDRLRQALRSGNVSVPDSRTFQSIESYLIPPDEWRLSRIEIAHQDDLPLNFKQHWKKVELLLKKQLRSLDDDFPHNAHLTINDDCFHVARLEKLEEPASARGLKKQMRRMIARRQLGDLLLEVNSWTGFLSSFTRLSSGRPITEEDIGEQIKLLTVLIAEACNIGLQEMTLASPGISYKQLEEVHGNFVREETVASAAAVLVNFHLLQPIVEAWGQGTTSSSDARVYGVPVNALNATYHPKYFASAGRGISVYTHVSDLWIPFYTQVITCHARQAPFILDGLLYHQTRLEPKEHYTDTHGYTDLIFAVCHLLGVRFAPRIKDLPEQRLWVLPMVEPFSHIEGVFAGKINRAVIEESWDEMIRLVASIKRGEVRASLIIGKLSALSHYNKLFRGFQELGRLLKTAYLAEYISDPELRRRVLLGLNKGETLNSLARKMRFGGNGELRDRTYEDQLNAASCLNLLLAAIVVWNAVHLQGCVQKLRADGCEINNGDIRFLSPLSHRHLNIYGQYAFDVENYAVAPEPDKLLY